MSNWTKIISDGKGGFDAFENWNLGNEIIYQGAWKIIFALLFGLIFSSVIPIVLLFIYPYEKVKAQYENIAIGVLVSLLFLLDFWFGGFSWIFFSIWFENGMESAINIHTWFACLNGSLMITGIILRFTNHYVSPNVDMVGPSKTIFYGVIIVLTYFLLYPVFDSFMGPTRADSPIWFLEEIYTNSIS